MTVSGIGFDKSSAIIFLGWFACEVIPYYSTSESLVCETPPLDAAYSQYEYANMEIAVYNDGVLIEGCRVYGKCYFMYRPGISFSPHNILTWAENFKIRIY